MSDIDKAQICALSEELIAAFRRFFEDPSKTDKGCVALTATARALYELGENAAVLGVCPEQSFDVRPCKQLERDTRFK